RFARPSSPRVVVAEIDIHLHSRRQLSRLLQIDQDFRHADIGETALIARADAARLDDRSDREDLPVKFALAKGGRTHQHRLSDLDLPKIAFIQFRTHAHSRDIAEQQKRLRRGRRRHLPRLGVDLKDGAGNRRADRQFFDRGFDPKQVGAGNIELAFRLTWQRNAEIGLEPAEVGLLLLQAILRARQPGARRLNVGIRAVLGPLCGCRPVEVRPRFDNGLFAVGGRVLRLAADGGSTRRALVVPRTLVHGDLCLRGKQPRLGFIVLKTYQWFSGKHLVIDLDQHFADASNDRRSDLDLARPGFDAARGHRLPELAVRSLRSCYTRVFRPAGKSEHRNRGGKSDPAGDYDVDFAF